MWCLHSGSLSGDYFVYLILNFNLCSVFRCRIFFAAEKLAFLLFFFFSLRFLLCFFFVICLLTFLCCMAKKSMAVCLKLTVVERVRFAAIHSLSTTLPPPCLPLTTNFFFPPPLLVFKQNYLCMERRENLFETYEREKKNTLYRFLRR